MALGLLLEISPFFRFLSSANILQSWPYGPTHRHLKYYYLLLEMVAAPQAVGDSL